MIKIRQGKNRQGLSVVNYFCKKKVYQSSDRVSNTCYTIVAGKILIYKLKQKKVKNVKKLIYNTP